MTEENEEDAWESNSISTLIIIIIRTNTMSFCAKTFSQFSLLSSDPLFSTIITLYTIIFIFFPHHFLRILFSPVLILTGILLLTLLRLGSHQRHSDNESNSVDHEKCNAPSEDRVRVIGSKSEVCFDPNPVFEDRFVGWDVGAPLEVIYEEYEGGKEEDEKGSDPNLDSEPRQVGIERYPSLSMYYPESDSDSSSDGEFPAITPDNICFRWDEEDREELIEISLDVIKGASEFHVEEENLIEIDISPTRCM